MAGSKGVAPTASGVILFFTFFKHTYGTIEKRTGVSSPAPEEPPFGRRATTGELGSLIEGELKKELLAPYPWGAVLLTLTYFPLGGF
jgi:hypothetical protein